MALIHLTSQLWAVFNDLLVFVFVVCFAVSDEVRMSDRLILAEVAFEDVVNVNVVVSGHVRLSDGQITA